MGREPAWSDSGASDFRIPQNLVQRLVEQFLHDAEETIAKHQRAAHATTSSIERYG
ncbi:MAG: hypothetical protein JSR34_01515 [Proteobacteria bacterium]|nr:hypothetical protein [Pseudomonadota bacterium]